MKVGAKVIDAAIAAGAATVDAVAAATTAGANCGSCRIEIGRMLQAHDGGKRAVNHAA
jgi:assimilatory nitrate reductase catalytic subunit